MNCTVNNEIEKIVVKNKLKVTIGLFISVKHFARFYDISKINRFLNLSLRKMEPVFTIYPESDGLAPKNFNFHFELSVFRGLLYIMVHQMYHKSHFPLNIF
jgi:hypothetical protein